MSQGKVRSKRESILLASLLWLQLLFGVFWRQEIFVLLVSWTLIQLIVGNAKRIPIKPKSLHFLRMTLYFLPYGIPILFCNINAMGPVSQTNKTIISMGIAVVIFFVWLFLNRKALKVMNSKEVIAFSPCAEKHVLLLHIYNKIGAAIFEEFFFRWFILSINIPWYVSWPTSTFLFWLSHWGTPWGKDFSANASKDQITIGFLSGGLFEYSHSIMPSIFLHLLINLTACLNVAMKIDRWYVRPEKYEAITLQDTNCEDITL